MEFRLLSGPRHDPGSIQREIHSGHRTGVREPHSRTQRLAWKSVASRTGMPMAADVGAGRGKAMLLRAGEWTWSQFNQLTRVQRAAICIERRPRRNAATDEPEINVLDC